MVFSYRCLFLDDSADETDQRGSQKALKLRCAFLRLSLDS